MVEGAIQHGITMQAEGNYVDRSKAFSDGSLSNVPTRIAS